VLSYQIEAFGRPLARVLRDTPAPRGTEVLLRVAACGVCHSDVHLHDGYFSLGGQTRLDLARSVAPPRTLGHEIAGSVVALGPDVTADAGVQVGDRRVAFPWIGCGGCALCAAGDEHLCPAPRALGFTRDGGFADHVLVPHPRYLVAFDGLDEHEACTYACAGLTAYSALKKVPPLGARDALLIVGAGGVGLSAIRLARRLTGVAPVVAEIDRTKWDVARAAGAADVVDPAAEGAAKALVKATGGGVAVALDFVGAGRSFEFGLGALRKAGQLICVGLLGGEAAVVPAMLALKALRVAGSYVGSLAELRELLALARDAALPPLPLVTRPLAEANAALDDLRQGRVRGRAVLRP
jgi:alcohol dehydrogenase/propanol-preferring alcohol dehydrogenase